MASHDYETITYEERNGVAWVTLNRPERHNAFNSLMQREVRDVWRTMRFNEDVRCAVLTGAGEKAFCTGIDRMEQMGGASDESTDFNIVGSHGGTPFHFNDPGDNLGPKSCDLWKPVIAAVNGMACGGAFYMLGEVEFIIAAEHATFFDPHVTYGMTASFEPIHMAGITPFCEIMRLSLMGNYERLSAKRAYEIGMVSEVVPGDQLLDAAGWCAERIAAQPKLAIEGTVRAIWGTREFGSRHAVHLGYAYVSMGTNQDSIAEGQKLFESGTRIELEGPLSSTTTAPRVAIVGAALSDCGRVDDKTVFELHYQAASRAVADAGLTKDDIDGFASCGTGMQPPTEVAEYCGLRPNWVDSTSVGGSSWEFMVEHATAAIQAGHVETVVLAYGSTTRADLKKKRRSANIAFAARGPYQFDVPFGHTLISKYAMVTRRHMIEFGTTIDQLAEIAVSARYNASLNPEAYYRDPITIEDVRTSRMIADPFTKLHCCIRSDGGGAVVLTSEERARDLAKTPILVLGTGEAVSHTTMSEWPDVTESPAYRSGAQAFGRAGVTQDDIDCCQFYDAFTGSVVLTLEAMGFCAKGEGGAFVEDGKLRLGGALPTNTDGGGLSACHPGMRGMFLLVEAVRQLRWEAEGRQVPNAELCCVNGTGGWFTSASTVILGRG